MGKASPTREPSLPMALWLTSRPLSWINTAFPFGAAWLLSTGSLDATFIVGTLFFLIPYNLAMYGINDVFDYASDLANPRKVGVEGIRLPPRWHRATLVASLVACAPFVIALVVLGAAHPSSWLALAVSLFAVFAYSYRGLRFKEVPFLDSVTSSTHFVSPAIVALAMAGTTVTWPLIAALGAFFLWGMASHAFGAVQDVVPDREGGIASIATVLGAAPTVRLAVGLWAGAGLLMLATPWPVSLIGLGALPYIAIALPFLRVRDDESGTANRSWRKFLGINYAVGAGVTIVVIVAVMAGVLGQ